MRSKFKGLTVAALTLTLGLGAAACGDSDSGGGTDKEITIGVVSGWAEGEAATALWKRLLTDKGYKVEVKNLDTGPLYAGMSKGDVDLFVDSWLPGTHEDYWKQYGDKLEKVGVWYDSAPLTIAVPNYSPLKTLDDLKGKGGSYGGKIVGIEKSSGLYRVSQEEMLPAYGLKDEYKVTTSSTAAMLTELKKAVDAKKDIVVTLWRPHWAYTKYPIRDLQDPKGAMGKPDGINTIARKDFGKDQPEVTGWLKKFRMDDKQLGSLEDLMENQYKGKPDEAVDAWLKTNQSYATSLTS
ncbi:glycine betaine/proline transport system substrate-binding protein [Actinomadura coerulea]|uniref:Glycine betaine/proline transport system substrate-binding protein n=1 Tax=Actinomadura coerulea TaxID=46159 RepID=A0A7X0G444_9ACTN|nr:glycine betaine ABC transporter substrate-binding protein [Actinomadura coerulea]MBB6399006.1 glycine betaine/proline transport system substrate-binding protein [Actinomadura coerulea]